ncbi:unnamed protein product, partial [Laminaria digitata]
KVLDSKGSSYASDVYSFGMVAWEVLSGQIPCENSTDFRRMCARVVWLGERPAMPAEAADDIADIVCACWAEAPKKRPSSSEIVGSLR